MRAIEDYPVLYVDDDLANLETTRYVLGDAFRLHTCSDPVEALELLREQEFAVLLTDQRMPGMTGVELCEQARVLSPTTARIILTAYSDSSAVVAAIHRGSVLRYLSKPFRADVLSQALRSGIEEHISHVARRQIEEHMLRAVPSLAVRGVQAEIGQSLSLLVEPIIGHLAVADDELDVLDRVGDSSQASSLERLRAHHRDLAGAAIAVRAFATRLMMGDARTGTGETQLAASLDTALRGLRTSLETIADVHVEIIDSPRVVFEPSAMSHVLVQLIHFAIQRSVSSVRGELSFRIRALGEYAEFLVRYTSSSGSRGGTTPALTEPEGLSTVRSILEEAGGRVVRDSGTHSTAYTLMLPIASAGASRLESRRGDRETHPTEYE